MVPRTKWFGRFSYAPLLTEYTLLYFTVSGIVDMFENYS